LTVYISIFEKKKYAQLVLIGHTPTKTDANQRIQ